MNSLSDEITNRLKPLLGMKLSPAHRAADMRMFHFGQIRPYKGGTVGEYALHVQCASRIEGPREIVTGRSDLWEPAETGDDFDWNSRDYERGENLQDKLIGEFLTTKVLSVEAVRADDYGGVTIALSGGYRLVLFPAGSTGEQWRLFRPADTTHFVIYSGQREPD